MSERCSKAGEREGTSKRLTVDSAGIKTDSNPDESDHDRHTDVHAPSDSIGEKIPGRRLTRRGERRSAERSFTHLNASSRRSNKEFTNSPRVVLRRPLRKHVSVPPETLHLRTLSLLILVLSSHVVDVLPWDFGGLAGVGWNDSREVERPKDLSGGAGVRFVVGGRGRFGGDG